MPGPLVWQTKLNDGVSGTANRIGSTLTGLTSKFDALANASKRADTASKLKGPQVATSIGPKGASATSLDGLALGTGRRDTGPQSDLGKTMAAHDAVAFDEAKKKIDASTRALEAYAKARAKSQGGTLFDARSTMGKTGANVSGVMFGKPNTNWVSSLLSQLAKLSPAAANAGSKLLGLAGSADKALEKFGGLGGVLGKAGSAIMSVAAAAAQAAAYIVGAFAAIGVAAAKYIAEIQAFKQSTMFAFTQLLGSAGMAESAWKKVTAISLSTGTSLMDVGAAFNSLLAQGFKLDAVDTLVKRMADLKAINPATNIEGIARAIAQIKTAGTLQGDELNQLAEAGLNKQLVYEELAKSMGKTVAEVKKLQSADKITSEQALDAVNKAMARAAGGRAPGELAAEAANKTLSGAFGKLVASIQVFASKLNIDFSAVGRFADRVGKVLSGDSGARFGKAIEQAFEKVLSILDGISEKDIASAFDTATATINGAANAAVGFANAIRTIDGWLAAVSSKTSTWGTIFAALGGVATAVWNAIVDGAVALVAPFMALVGPLMRLIELFQQLGAAKTSFLSGGMDLGLSNALGAKKSPEGGASQTGTQATPDEIIKRLTSPDQAAAKPGAADAQPSKTKVDVDVKVAFDSPMFRAVVTEIVQEEMAKA